MDIRSNGSKWAGQAPDTFEHLLGVLTREPLDPTFEAYGNFVLENTAETVRCWGNFFELSHVFDISGTPAEMLPLVEAIRANQERADYQAARRVYACSVCPFTTTTLAGSGGNIPGHGEQGRQCPGSYQAPKGANRQGHEVRF